MHPVNSVQICKKHSNHKHLHKLISFHSNPSQYSIFICCCDSWTICTSCSSHLTDRLFQCASLVSGIDCLVHNLVAIIFFYSILSDRLLTRQLADWSTRGCHRRLCVLSFRFFWRHLRDRELSSPRVGVSASCPVTI